MRHLVIGLARAERQTRKEERNCQGWATTHRGSGRNPAPRRRRESGQDSGFSISTELGRPPRGGCRRDAAGPEDMTRMPATRWPGSVTSSGSRLRSQSQRSSGGTMFPRALGDAPPQLPGAQPTSVLARSSSGLAYQVEQSPSLTSPRGVSRICGHETPYPTWRGQGDVSPQPEASPRVSDQVTAQLEMGPAR